MKRDLILLASIPLALAALLAAIVYIPQALARPSHDFIYATCDSYRCNERPEVRNGRVTLSLDLDTSFRTNERATLRYYDVDKQSSRALSLEEAQSYKLDNSSRSPDGYVLTRESSSSGGFLFWGSSSGGQWILKNGMYKKHVDLADAGDYYSSNVTFVGWVE